MLYPEEKLESWLCNRVSGKIQIIKDFQFPSEHHTIEKIKNSSANFIILGTRDPWYQGYFTNLLSFMKESKKTFFLVTLEYQNYSFFSNVHVLSFPYFYWTRHRSNLRIKDRGLKYGFSCLNRRINAHRALLGISLWRRKLLNQIIYSQDDNAYEILGHALNLINSRDPDNEFRSLIPIRYAETIDQPIPNDHSIDHPAYHHAYCNIVTETSIEYFDHEYFIPAQCVTEKSYKPFLSSQIPIFFASPGHDRYLKNLGFEVMEDFIGYDFDQAMVTQKCEIIGDLIELGKEYTEDYYFSHIREIEHNHQLINSDKIESMILDSVNNFLKECL